jgi:hypothetical protein
MPDRESQILMILVKCILQVKDITRTQLNVNIKP